MSVMHKQDEQRLYAAIEAHLTCARRIDNIDEVTEAVRLANETGDVMENAAANAPRTFWQPITEARKTMHAALQRLNRRALLARRIAMLEEQCAWSRAVLARVPELMKIP